MTKCQASIASRPLLLAAISAAGLFLAQASSAATITVTGTGDAVFVDGSVSLREAIASINNGANVNVDVVAAGTYGVSDTINFGISGAGLHTIILVGVPLDPVTKQMPIK